MDGNGAARRVRLGPDDTLRIGRRFLLEEVRTTNVLGEIHEMDLGPEAVTGPSDAALVERVREAIAGLPAHPRDPAVAFVDVDPSAPFLGPDFTPVGPPSAVPEVVDLPLEELWERATRPEPDRSIVRTRTQRQTRGSEAQRHPGDTDG